MNQYALVKYLNWIIPGFFFQAKYSNSVLVLKTNAFFLYNLVFFLKHHSVLKLNFLVDICVYDFLDPYYRFWVIYVLRSSVTNTLVYVKLNQPYGKFLPTLVGLHQCANWLEREIWDMFGIFILEHPDLRRLLTDYGFVGHPLRKDFPLSGFTELFYDEHFKRLNYVPIELSQECRTFNFNTPWLK